MTGTSTTVILTGTGIPLPSPGRDRVTGSRRARPHREGSTRETRCAASQSFPAAPQDQERQGELRTKNAAQL
jgi:hypothetical protein